jgi:hypothetical protein
MADVVITVPKADVYKLVARRTSLTSKTDPVYGKNTTEQKQQFQLHGEGDRITGDYLLEAAKEALKLYVSRQGDATGTPFEVTATDIIYRFNEATPVLTQAAALKTRLLENTRDYIVYFMFYLLYKTNGNNAKMIIMKDKYAQLVEEITGDLYRLHD